MRRRLTLSSRRFLGDRRGVSAMEFAICAPVMFMLLLIGIDTTRYVMATEKIENVASTIAQMLSQNQTGMVNYIDLQFYHDSAMVIFPQVLSDAKQQNINWSSDIGISFASVNFSTKQQNCGTSCTYVPQVQWTGGTTPRSCTVPMVAASDTAPPSPGTLPQDVFGPGSIIVVDVTFNFRPTIAPTFLQSVPIKRSYYMAPRYVASLKYQAITGDNGIAAACPGIS